MKKYLCFMLIALMAVASFVSCKAEPEHVHNYIAVEGKEATCTESGYSSYVACECDEKLGYNVIPAAHKYDAICAGGHTICSGCGKNHNPAIKFENYDAKQADWSFVDGKTILIASCGCATENFTVAIGSVGPAGGFIVYDVDADNDAATNDGLASAELGWRFIEAAPADLRVVEDKPTVDKSVAGYSTVSPELQWHPFGYYRTSDSGDNLYINGTSSYSDSDCTLTVIGEGESNTEQLVTIMGSSTYAAKTGSVKISNYAAKLCYDLMYNGYDDWFLPSIDELDLIYKNLKSKDADGTLYSLINSNYWSSSESNTAVLGAWNMSFSSGDASLNTRNSSAYVRPCRTF